MMVSLHRFLRPGLLSVLLSLALVSPVLSVPSEFGELAPDFTISTVDGSSFGLAEHRGRVVVLMFTAPGCGGCIPELRALSQVHSEYADRGVDILVLNLDPYSTARDLVDFKDFIGGGDHAWAQDEGGVVALAYGVRALETTVIIDRDGRVVYRDEYATGLNAYRAALEPLL